MEYIYSDDENPYTMEEDLEEERKSEMSTQQQEIRKIAFQLQEKLALKAEKLKVLHEERTMIPEDDGGDRDRIYWEIKRINRELNL